jgi:uncharacterized protein
METPPGGLVMANPWEDRKKGLEDEYFHRKEQEALAKARQQLGEQERGQSAQASVMRCPKCGATLEDLAFQEIQVERCTGCRGIWLDSGELEQVTARETEGWLSHFWRSSKGH